MYQRKFHIITVLFLVWNFSFSQQYTNYTIKKGLPSNHVYKIVQDYKGFMWAITENGMVRFNGTDFKEFTTKEGLPTNDIWEIATTPDGKVWFFCKAAKIGYIEDEVVHTFGAEYKSTIFYPLKIAQYGTDILFESDGLWYYLNLQNEWEAVDLSLEYNGTNPLVNKVLKTKVKVNKITENRFIIQYREVDSLVFWITKKGYVVLNTITGKHVKERYNNRHSIYGRINNFNDQLQITDTSYLAVLDKKFKIYDTLYIPPKFNSHNIIKDKSDNLWLATFKNGIYKIPWFNRKIKYSLISEKVTSLRKIGNTIIAGVFDKGFYAYNKNTKQFEPYIKKEGHSYPAAYDEDLNTAWFIDKFTVFEDQYNATGKLILKKERLLDEGIKYLIFSDNYLWGFGSFELKRIDYQNFEILGRYPTIGINTIVSFNNSIILGTTDGMKKLYNGKIVSINSIDSLFQKPVLSLHKIDNDWLVIGTGGYGAYLTNFDKTIPFPYTEFLSIKETYVTGNEIFLATNKGLYFFNKIGDRLTFVKKFTEEEGMPTREINSVVVKNDSVFVATDNGIAIFPKDIRPPLQLLGIYFENIFYNAQQINKNNPSVLYKSNNSLNVKIATIDYSEKLTPYNFRYQLLPNQNEWVETTSTTLDFSNLRPNTYTLKIGLENLEEAYSFTINPLWWQRPFAKIIFVLLGLLSAGFVFFKVLKNSQKKHTKKIIQEKQLAQAQLQALRSQMNPHFVFNSLAAIQFYINENDFKNSEKYLVKFSKLIRQFFELSKEKEIAINDEVELLKNYLAIEKLRFKEKLNFSIQVDQNLDSKNFKIPTMLLQPIVENAVNHGVFNKLDNGNISINFKKETKEAVIVEITDDGVGYLQTKKKKKRKVKSTNVLKDRLFYLNQSGNWSIKYSRKEAFPSSVDKGNIATFKIKRLR